MSCREKRAGDADADADANVHANADADADDGAGKCTIGGAALACAAYSARRPARQPPVQRVCVAVVAVILAEKGRASADGRLAGGAVLCEARAGFSAASRDRATDRATRPRGLRWSPAFYR